MAVEPYDFHSRTELSANAEGRAVEHLREAFPRVALILASFVRRDVLGEFGRIAPTDSVPMNSSELFMLNEADDNQTGPAVGVLVMTRVCVTSLAEVLLGGAGDGEDRVPTDFERQLVARHLGSALEPLREVLAVTSGRVLALHPVPDARQALSLATVSVIFSLSVDGRSFECGLTLAPTVLDAGSRQPVDGPVVSMARALLDATVELSVSFDAVHIPVAELELIAPGDVIRLDHPLHRPLQGYVFGRPLLALRPGSVGRRLGGQVVAVLAKGEEAPVVMSRRPTAAEQSGSADVMPDTASQAHPAAVIEPLAEPSQFDGALTTTKEHA